MSPQPEPPATSRTVTARTVRLPILVLAVVVLVSIADLPASGVRRLMILGAAPVRVEAGLVGAVLSSWQVAVSAVVHVVTLAVTAVGSLSYGVLIPLLLGTTALAAARRPVSP
jgi:hypothetical protein